MTLRWPWVARSTLERAELAHAQLTALHEQRAKELRADLLGERTRSASLTATVLRLKRDGAVLLPPASSQLKPERKEATAIEKAIDENPRARRDSKLAAHLLQWAEEEMRRGTDEEDIEERLRTWGDPDAADDDDDDLL